MKRSLNIETLVESRLPKRYWKLGTEHYLGKTRLAWDQCVKYINKFEKALEEGVGLCFIGPTDQQKTFLMSFVLKHLMVSDYNVLYCTANEIVEIMFHKREEFKTFSFDRFKESHVLSIDDLEPLMLPPVREVVLRVFKMRADAGLPFIVATRQLPEHWGSVFGSELSLLLTDRCVKIFCECDEIEKALRVARVKEKFLV